jgi:hypothetical protein
MNGYIVHGNKCKAWKKLPLSKDGIKHELLGHSKMNFNLLQCRQMQPLLYSMSHETLKNIMK